MIIYIYVYIDSICLFKYKNDLFKYNNKHNVHKCNKFIIFYLWILVKNDPDQ